MSNETIIKLTQHELDKLIKSVSVKKYDSNKNIITLFVDGDDIVIKFSYNKEVNIYHCLIINQSGESEIKADKIRDLIYK